MQSLQKMSSPVPVAVASAGLQVGLAFELREESKPFIKKVETSKLDCCKAVYQKSNLMQS